MKVEAVTFDVGGVIYSDDVFKRAIYAALQHFGAPVTTATFDSVYDKHLESQAGSLRSKLCIHFFGSLDLKSQLMEYATERWIFTDEDIYADAKGVMVAMKKCGAKIALVANQPASVIDTLKAHGIYELVDFAAISAIVGIEKPSPKIFSLALSKLSVDPSRSIHIGNRIDTDVIPAHRVGMKAVWVRRGEANPNPSAQDLKIPEIVVSNLIGLPELIDAL